MPLDFDRSVDWMLDGISLGVGLELTIEYSPFQGDSDTLDARGHDVAGSRYRISFQHPLAWAFVDLSRMWQYFPSSDCPPVVEEVDRDDGHVYIREFSINREAFGNDWRRQGQETAMVSQQSHANG